MAWSGLFGLADAERCVNQVIGVGRTGVLGDEQQDAPVWRLEDGQQTPGAVQVEPADPGQGFSGQADACGRQPRWRMS